MARVLIADDHAIVRRRLVRLLREADPAMVVEEAESGSEALGKASGGGHDLILVDIAMPGSGGLDVLREIKARRPEVPVLVISMHREEPYAVWALRAGASGYLVKDRAAEELSVAVRKVLAGGRYINGAIAEKLAGEPESDRGDPLAEVSSVKE